MKISFDYTINELFANQYDLNQRLSNNKSARLDTAFHFAMISSLISGSILFNATHLLFINCLIWLAIFALLGAVYGYFIYEYNVKKVIYRNVLESLEGELRLATEITISPEGITSVTDKSVTLIPWTRITEVELDDERLTFLLARAQISVPLYAFTTASHRNEFIDRAKQYYLNEPERLTPELPIKTIFRH